MNNLKNHDNEIVITHQELAARIGSAREVVSRLLKNLEKDKKVLLLRGKIKILSPL
jgi:CRP/FNR family transcriptional regulator